MFLKHIIDNDLISFNDKIIIAFSGGPDSVFLTEKLVEIRERFNLKLHLAYVNHNIRKDVSNDIKILKNISSKYDIDYSILEVNKEKKLKSEDSLRNIRYEVIETLRKNLSFDKIATGHNKTDNAETVIFRILRGTSKKGLKGIKVKRDNIIRPILCFEKKYILDNIKNEYAIDETNLENIYSRNIIRNMIFPIFEKINTSYIDNILNLYTNLDEDKIKLEIIEKLNKYNIELSARKINEIYKIYNSKQTKIIDLNEKYYWYKSYDRFEIIEKKNFKKESKAIILKYGETIQFNDYIVKFTKVPILEKKAYKGYTIYSNQNFSPSSFCIVRTRENGDKIGSKKLKNLFINDKVDMIERNSIPIIEFDSKIVMVGDRYKLKDLENNHKIFICIRRKYEK